MLDLYKADNPLTANIGILVPLLDMETTHLDRLTNLPWAGRKSTFTRESSLSAR